MNKLLKKTMFMLTILALSSVNVMAEEDAVEANTGITPTNCEAGVDSSRSATVAKADPAPAVEGTTPADTTEK